MFHLRDALSGSEFSGRVNDVFSALGSGSVKQPDKSKLKDNDKPNFDQLQMERSLRPQDNPYKKHKGEGGPTGDKVEGGPTGDKKEEMFKHPAEFLRPETRAVNPGRCDGVRGGGRRGRGRYVPDHKKNPEKWTKYSLEDVETMTEKTNTTAALQFIQILREKKMDVDDEPKADLSSKPVFNKPTSLKPRTKTSTNQKAALNNPTNESGDSDTEPAAAKPTFVGSKQVLPEYVVGASNPGSQKKTKTPATSEIEAAAKPRPSGGRGGKALKLSHLDDEGDDENEDE